MNFRKIITLVLLLFSLNVFAQRQITIPNGKMDMLDGKFDASEWNDAKKIYASAGYYVFAKTSGHYLLIAIYSSVQKNIYTDLYLNYNGLITDFHASAKLGQPKYLNGQWADWKWWNNSGWVANVSRIDSYEKKTFLAENCREYQIDLSLFHTKATGLFLTAGIMNTDEKPHFRVPQNAVSNKPEKWLQLVW